MDIDIDLADRSVLLRQIDHRVAALETGKKHNSGVYATEIPHNPVDNVATIDYKTAHNRGYFKIDFLNVSIYQDIKDEEHLVDLMNKEPMWELLEHAEFVNKVFHLSGHSDVTQAMKPRTITQLAAVLAMIRPAKRYLIGKHWETVLEEIWVKPSTSDYYWKKSHAFSYAVAVVVHANLLCEQISS